MPLEHALAVEREQLQVSADLEPAAVDAQWLEQDEADQDQPEHRRLQSGRLAGLIQSRFDAAAQVLYGARAHYAASGTVTATYRTDEWGIPTVTTGASTQPYGFTGEPVDATVRIVDGAPQVIPARPGVTYRPADVEKTFLSLVAQPSGQVSPFIPFLPSSNPLVCGPRRNFPPL